MTMRSAGRALALLACVLGASMPPIVHAATAPYAQTVPVVDSSRTVTTDAAPPPTADFWVSFGAGYYDGQDYDPPAGAAKRDAQKTGGWEVFAALNYGGPLIGRVRVNWLTEYTSNTAEEVAGEIGLALYSTQVYALAGVSRLTDIANDRQRPIVGVPLELLFYPTRGLEIGVHGNLNSQSDFIGVTLGGVFGKRRAR